MRPLDRAIKPVLFAACTAPMLKLAWGAYHQTLGANPIDRVLNRLGWWALFMLVASLAATPMQLVFGWGWPIRLRRMIGLFAFTYATLHLLTYAGLDQAFDWGDIWRDVAKKQFITVGFCAWCLLLPLAVTSTNGWVKRLGYGRWKQIHRLSYVAAGCGCVHFIWRVKADISEPLRFCMAVGGLLAIRVLYAWVGDRKAIPARA